MTELAPHQVPESWSSRAKDYEAMFVPFSDGAAEAALRNANIQPGERFLDVATGTGAVTIRAARAGAAVTAVDFSEGMLALLEQRLAQESIQGVVVREMDGQSLEFGDAEFDVAGSNFGLIFFPDVGKGLREMRRVLRPGGRAFVTSVGDPSQSRLMQLVIGSIMSVAPRFQPPPSPASVQLTDPEELKQTMEAAGFTEVSVKTIQVDWPIRDAAEFWVRWGVAAPPVAAMMTQIDKEVLDAAKHRFVESVEAEGNGETRVFKTEVLIGTGIR